jgi:hypothetical protein
LSLMQNMSVSEEPEDMDDTREGGEEEEIDDADLPAWAKRSNFVDDKLGLFCFDNLALYRTHHLLVQVVSTHFYPTSFPQIFNPPWFRHPPTCEQPSSRAYRLGNSCALGTTPACASRRNHGVS